MPSLPRLPLPGRRDDDEDDGDAAGTPFWQKLLLVVVGGLAEGAAPMAVTYLLHKLDPGVFGSEDEDEDDDGTDDE